MNNKFIINSFLLACASFAFSNAYAMESEVSLERSHSLKAGGSPTLKDPEILHATHYNTRIYEESEGNDKLFISEIVFCASNNIEKETINTITKDLEVLGIYNFEEGNDHKILKENIIKNKKFSTFSLCRSDVESPPYSALYIMLTPEEKTIREFLSVFTHLQLIPDIQDIVKGDAGLSTKCNLENHELQLRFSRPGPLVFSAEFS